MKDVYAARRTKYEALMAKLKLSPDDEVETGFSIVVTTQPQLSPDAPKGSATPPPIPTGGGKTP